MSLQLRSGWIRGVTAYVGLVRVVRKLVWPGFDLVVRFWIGQPFFVAGVLKLGDWRTALTLATHEHPVAWVSPQTAALTGAAVEIVAPVLLVVGCLTRYAALALLLLTGVIQSAYQAHDPQLFWIALLGWYVVQGAGPLSLDTLLRRGLADSALPLIAPLIRAAEALRTLGTPAYLSALRVWVGVTFLLVSVHATSQAAYFPVGSSMTMSHYAALVVGVALLLGVASRGVCLLLGFGSVAAPMMSAAVPYDMPASLTLLLLALEGGGVVSVERLIDAVSRRWIPELAGRLCFALDTAPRVVIVGAGFGGLSCAMSLRTARASVTLIDRGNHHLFQPLLYQVATAALSPGDIATPVRSLFKDAFNTRVLFGTVDGIDAGAKTVLMGAQRVPYDFLVIATGATHSYFGKETWQPFAPGLKRIEDATEIRRRLLLAFERAEACDDPARRSALLTFLVVGAGPTGVELAGAIAELARFGMDKEFRQFDPASARVVLVQSGSRILPAFPAALSQRAHASLQALGVEILLDSRVEGVDADGVLINGRRIAARTVLWAAGVAASPAAKWLGVAGDAAGRLSVDGLLQVTGLECVWALGDLASSLAWQGKPVPGLAPAAKQGGKYVATVIRALIQKQPVPPPFRYRHLGSLATIGRQAAVADFGWVQLWGAPAWWLWGVIHVGFLAGGRNRAATMLNWFWRYLTFGSGIRLITGIENDATPSERTQLPPTHPAERTDPPR